MKIEEVYPNSERSDRILLIVIWVTFFGMVGVVIGGAWRGISYAGLFGIIGVIVGLFYGSCVK